MSDTLNTLFPHQLVFSRQTDPAALLAAVPAKWAVYLFLDEAGAPFQLLCVKNLRASLLRRLGTQNELAPGRQVPYRQIVGRVVWRRVDSALEADLAYVEAAQTFFPESYRQFIARRHCWFLQISPQARLPSFTRTDVPHPAPGTRIFGPVSSRAAAQKLIESLADAFDLCRYPSILAQSPHGIACPYKQMHKCPAPCDGSVPLNVYSAQVDAAVDFLSQPAQSIEACAQRMRAAAGSLLFEQASREKARLQQLEMLAAAQLRDLEQMRYLAVLRGPRAGTFKLLLMSPWQIEPLLCLLAPEAGACAQAVELATRLAAEERVWRTACLPRLALLSQYLLRPAGDGTLLPLKGLGAADLEAVLHELRRRKPEPERPASDEGVLQDSQ